MVVRYWLAGCGILLLVFACALAGVCVAHAAETQRFEIKHFEIVGNSIFDSERLQSVVHDFTGPDKSAEDVEAARTVLEKFHHDNGFPTVLVNIPEQSVEAGVVRLQVIEARIRDVRVKDNKYYTKERILRDLPSLRPGNIIYLKTLQQELARANQSQDMKVVPVVVPTPAIDQLDVELEVTDKLPLHGKIGFDNRATPNSPDYKVSTSLSYDNLWQANHSLSVQYQTAVDDPAKEKVFAASYLLPNPWVPDHLIAMYGVISDSDKAAGEGFNVLGKGNIVGLRYIIPLTPLDDYTHLLTLGLDRKNFDETLSSESTEDIKTPIHYLPMLFSYTSTLLDGWGSTNFSLGINILFRELYSSVDEFREKRYRARGNYFYLVAGVERKQELPGGTDIYFKVDGQKSDQPLISNEQYSAGGMSNVRGYLESEVLGDDAFHSTTELSNKNLDIVFGEKEDAINFLPYIYYDVAMLWLHSPLPSEDKSRTIQGTGAGIRGLALDQFHYNFDIGRALESGVNTAAGTTRLYFNMEYQF